LIISGVLRHFGASRNDLSRTLRPASLSLVSNLYCSEFPFFGNARLRLGCHLRPPPAAIRASSNPVAPPQTQSPACRIQRQAGL